MKKFYSLIVALMATTCAFAQWTDTSTGVTFTPVDGSNFTGGEGAAKACDGNVNTKCGSGSTPVFLTIEASEPVSCVGYTITTANDNASYNGRNPEDWVVEGCNDLELEEWDIIDEVVNDQVLQDVNFTEFTFPCEPSARYKYFRFTVNRVEQAGAYLQFSEFHILGTVDHHWTLAETVPATCTEWGYFHYECSDGDGATRDEINPNDPPTGVHTIGADNCCVHCGFLAGTLAALPVTEGYNADVVIEELPVEDHLVLGIDNATTGFVTDDIVTVGGLPADGVIKTLGGYTVNVNYTDVAALRMGSDLYTLTVTPVNAYGLHILGTSAAGASTTNVTVVYDDDTTTEAQINWEDWFGGVDKNVALAGLNRYWNGNEHGSGQFRLFENVIKTDAAKAIVAVKFQQTTDKTPVIMAISYAAAGDENAISNVNVEQNNRIYNLQGIEVKSAQKGLYIINGKKVIL